MIKKQNHNDVHWIILISQTAYAADICAEPEIHGAFSLLCWSSLFEGSRSISSRAWPRVHRISWSLGHNQLFSSLRRRPCLSQAGEELNGARAEAASAASSHNRNSSSGWLPGYPDIKGFICHGHTWDSHLGWLGDYPGWKEGVKAVWKVNIKLVKNAM